METTQRKGARSTKDIPTDILAQLNAGIIATTNLVEWLAVDQQLLLQNVLQAHNRLHYLAPVKANIHQLTKQTVNTINEAIGTTLFELTTSQNDTAFLKIMASHPADLVRCWATYTIGKNEQLNLPDRLQQIQIFAADTHFGVREICWMAVRPKIATQLEKSIAILSEWTSHSDANIRRFVTESTRPRGVWCAHIEALEMHPEKAISLLEPLKSDPSKYVQDSVGNWLNDASKSQADFVTKLCQRWNQESPIKATQYIIKKALRTLNK